MRRYSEAVKADVKIRISFLHMQSVAWISDELGIHLAPLYNWRKSFLGDGDGVDRRKGSARLVGHRLS
jgi:transposase